ncbi:MAG: hypothetical protein P8J87_08490 [Verrucomicrobiales bacterium]|nr:hypothetical protein [Verrucomicrobiales bacterium]
MKIAFYLALFLTGLLTMRILNSEPLVPEDSTVSAQTLPLDHDTSQVAFETATFGMG